jgi:alkanesulfonate monooxygenase SsuD/methylene tetrahydromethanopterin reductase-like flavin-dependent oxidoreductase (luciferase family)
VPFPPTAERFERLEETIQICLQMWSDNDGAYVGKHYQLDETLCRPRPVSSPRPRILIGGGGERKTLRMVAQYADACNVNGDVSEVAHKIDVLRGHCEAVGRDPNEIEVTTMFRDLPPSPTVDDIVRNAEAFAAIGVSTLITGATGHDPAGWLESTFAPAIDQLASIEPARL